jgi:isopenicillin-N epimerase
MERSPVAFLAREIESLHDSARAVLANFVGARPDDMVFVSNATSGVNAVLRSLAFRIGDEVVTTDHTYGACRHTLDWVCQRVGAQVRVATIPLPLSDPEEIIEAVLNQVTPRTRLALLDHVTSATALVFPIERLTSELEDLGVPVLVDGAHAPGMVEINLRTLRPSYYTGNCHKWLCAPKGAAFLWVREEHQEQIVPPVISHGIQGIREGRTLFHDRFDWTGTDDPTAALCVPRCIEFLGSQLEGGWPSLRQRNHDLAVSARKLLQTVLPFSPLCPDSMLGSMASLRLEGPKADGRDPLQQRLLEKHNIEIQVAQEPYRMLRVSAQLYNSLEEYEQLADALLECRNKGVA